MRAWNSFEKLPSLCNFRLNKLLLSDSVRFLRTLEVLIVILPLDVLLVFLNIPELLGLGETPLSSGESFSYVALTEKWNEI